MSNVRRKLREREHLLLGWWIDSMLEPRSWRDGEIHDPESLPINELCSIKPATLSSHTCIVAQSGSGKSFFMGRLLEEILLATRSNIIVIDPNFDYARFHSVIPDKEWKPARYDVSERRGMLPTERSTSGFAKFQRSRAMSFRIYSNRKFRKNLPANVECLPLRIEYGQLSADFFYDENSPSKEITQMTVAHEFAMATMAVLLRKQYGTKLDKAKPFTATTSPESLTPLVALSPTKLRKQLEAGQSDPSALESKIRVACELAAFVTRQTWKGYLQALAHLRFEDVLSMETTFAEGADEPVRFQVIDISSAAGSYKDRVTEVILRDALTRAQRRWEWALKRRSELDERVPTFIVIEEAQNVAPSLSPGQGRTSCGEVVRRIAAEGRKYGLHLLIVTQRPEKVDPMILSEVENVALLRLNTPYALRKTIETFGFEGYSSRQLDSVLRFPVGRALLLGRWVENNPQLLYVAMRRSREGGRNLKTRYWAVPPTW